ncbi:hypothetical protein G210_2983 [Candida maltosa Xu316]|uniref:C2H2-type domain-containing protein n=1 Tax=Candida maltosa (strain Xu316) TaxID=1245528 RepID=M3IK28_CANMX|nr:hypothetical protein G210_2983 [Candida maltosa Xu316]
MDHINLPPNNHNHNQHYQQPPPPPPQTAPPPLQQQQQQQQPQQHFQQQNQLHHDNYPLINSHPILHPHPNLPILKSSASPPTSPNLNDPLLTSNVHNVSMNRKNSHASSTTSSSTASSLMTNVNDGQICQFCSKKFSHKTSLNRHLDIKKGDNLHPIDQINLIRSNNHPNSISHNRRRSSEVSFQSMVESNSLNSTNNTNTSTTNNTAATTPVTSTSTSISGVLSTAPITTTTNTLVGGAIPMGSTATTTTKKRRMSKKSMAVSQMSSDSASGQKEKSKLRRKLRDRRIKAKILTNEWFQDLFANNLLPFYHESNPDPNNPETFVNLVALYLPVNDWPMISSFPDKNCINLIINRMKVRNKLNLINFLNLSFTAYDILNDNQKKILWETQSSNILKSTIGKFSICDLYDIKSVISTREQSNFEEICRNDKLSAFVEVDSVVNNSPTTIPLPHQSNQYDELDKNEEDEDEENEEEEQNQQQQHQHQQKQSPPSQQQQQQAPQQFNQSQLPQNPGNSYMSQIHDPQQHGFDDFSSNFDNIY